MRGSLFLGALLLAVPEAHAERAKMLVLDFNATLGIDPELGKLLSQMLVAHLHTLERHEVTSSAALAALLKHEESKQLLGCVEVSCFADVGAVLGAEWLVSGTVSKLGERPVLTLRLLDVKASRLANQITETLPAEAGEYDEAMRVASFRILDLPVAPRPVAWHQNPWVWGGAGAAALAVALGGFLLLRPPSLPSTPLGQVVLDAG